MSTDWTAFRETSEDPAHDLERRVLPGVDTGEILYKRRLLQAFDTRRWMEELSVKLPWQQLPITMFGKTVMQPRRICWLTDSADLKYRYSGLEMTPVVWTDFPAIIAIKERVERVLNTRFNSVLCNLYRDGRDYMGYHADDERELGTRPVIASVSLGAERRFLLRSKHQSAKSTPIEYRLTDGSLLVMQGSTQQHWKHSVPKQLRILGPRINLTFRRISSQKL